MSKCKDRVKKEEVAMVCRKVWEGVCRKVVQTTACETFRHRYVSSRQVRSVSFLLAALNVLGRREMVVRVDRQLVAYRHHFLHAHLRKAARRHKELGPTESSLASRPRLITVI
jgi:hypothetical protein